MSKKKYIEERIKKEAKGGKITCAVLRRIAEEAGAGYRVAGKAANELNIKIKKCDLGCF